MKIHIVQKGDTLWNIAQKYGVDFEQLKKINGHLSDPNMIMPGMKIKVPTAGVPVKKETKAPVSPKKMHVKEHPYAEAKPFVSFHIDAELDTAVAPAPEGEAAVNAPAGEAPKAAVKKTPKAPEKKAENMPVNEAPNVPVNETPNVPVNETPNVPINEAPKAPAGEAPKAAVNETPKAVEKEAPKTAPKAVVNEAPNVPVNEMPNIPVNETPNVSINEAPKAVEKKAPKATAQEAPKTPKAEAKEGTKAKGAPVPPLVHTIPPVAPPPQLSFAQSLANVPPIPPKPSNILPDMMKEEDNESPAEWKGESAAESEDAPPLPNIPYVPVAPPTAPTFGTDQGCTPVPPVWPGSGFYVPPLPVMTPSYPPSPVPLAVGESGESPESGSAPFPGISESSSESLEPPLPGPGAADPFVPSAGTVFPPLGVATPVYAPPAAYPSPVGYPSFGYAPAYAPTQYYGGYALPAPYGYAPQSAPPLPWPGVVYPTSPAGYAPPSYPPSSAPPVAGPRLFSEPPDEESGHGEEQ
ncbi:SafA/ExsA family spore coat assembly protein [Geobacillus proteiniphilus]|uniref:SafA/ExsA family spore coat assembly protein n=1 Tax=Geobacillus proteiniphilus TaxID=860353 RepID=A0ABY9MGD0_9BACL|nr:MULTISPECIES: SafA/ExsA family spore coat assembly protein [Geobacillus]OPX04764.1 peptigoglycan-binding protein LysM [Geobacillus sp. LEMMY01]WMJ17029.1 SafA/ExsA family spore coat assembly protein [Geobacillus proteiniphilus]